MGLGALEVRNHGIEGIVKMGRIASALGLVRVYLTGPSLRMLFLGFSSGLPLLLVLGTLSFRLREAGVSLAAIGFMSWIGLVYAAKWAWAPAVDRVPLPFLTKRLGRRRAWLLLSQAMLACGLVMMAAADPSKSLAPLIGAALFTAFSSATQDIALDAYRIESADAQTQGVLAASYQFGYRIAMIWSGAGALAIAAAVAGIDTVGYSAAAWRAAYLAMAASVAVGLVTVLLSPEAPARKAARPKERRSLGKAVREAFLSPLEDFFIRYGKWTLVLLALVATYRMSDVVMGIMANPFYADMGFTKAEVAGVTKVFGVVMTLLGTFVGGLVVLRIGVMPALFLGAVLSAATNLLFSALALIGHSVPFLVVTVSADNLAGGLASASFVAFLSGMTSREFSATQYALLSSLMLLLPKAVAGFSGVMVEHLTFNGFFMFTAALGVPVALLVLFAARSRKFGTAKGGGS